MFRSSILKAIFFKLTYILQLPVNFYRRYLIIKDIRTKVQRSSPSALRRNSPSLAFRIAFRTIISQQESAKSYTSWVIFVFQIRNQVFRIFQVIYRTLMPLFFCQKVQLYPKYLPLKFLQLSKALINSLSNISPISFLKYFIFII